MIGQINSSFQYVNDNMNQIQESANHLTEIRAEINKRIEEARKQRITNGNILVGECVLGLVSVVVTCGAGVLVVVTVITTTMGGFVAFDSIARGIEGTQEIYYDITGDIDTASINMVRDISSRNNKWS